LHSTGNAENLCQVVLESIWVQVCIWCLAMAASFEKIYSKG